VEVARDEDTVVEAKLQRTAQRTTAYGLLGVGAASVVAGGVLTGLAFHAQALAQDDQTNLRNGQPACGSVVTCTGALNYENDRATRDSFRVAAGVAFGAGAVLATTSVLLFTFDQPTVEPAPLLHPDRAPRSPAPRAQEVGVAPLLLPNSYGASIWGHF
jgi:hypothetical protein